MRPSSPGFFVFAFACQAAAPPLGQDQLVADKIYSAVRGDGTFVYYIDDARNANGMTAGPIQLRLMRVSVNGGSPEVLAQLPPPRDANLMAAFVIDATTAYCPVDGKIVAVPLVGGEPVTLVDESPATVQAVTADAASLYWLEDETGGAPPRGSDTRLLSISKSGGGPTILASTGKPLGAAASEIAVAGANVYWAGSTCGTNDVACLTNDVIWMVPTNGGSVVAWASSQPNAEAVATDGSSLYWLSADHGASNGSLMSAPLASSSDATTLAQDIPSPWTGEPVAWAVQVDVDGGVLWVDAAGSGLFRILDGSRTTYATAAADRINFFSVDSNNVYWSTQYGGIFHAVR